MWIIISISVTVYVFIDSGIFFFPVILNMFVFCDLAGQVLVTTVIFCHKVNIYMCQLYVWCVSESVRPQLIDSLVYQSQKLIFSSAALSESLHLCHQSWPELSLLLESLSWFDHSGVQTCDLSSSIARAAEVSVPWPRRRFFCVCRPLNLKLLLSRLLTSPLRLISDARDSTSSASAALRSQMTSFLVCIDS